ncbi:MAG: magnesium/cobalt transporter CorA [Gammaproteobacteria bacterium]
MPGSAPGTMIAPAESSSPVIDVIAYGPKTFVEHDDVLPAAIGAIRSEAQVTWVNVSGLADVDLIRQIGAIFNLHRLAMEDVVNLHQRPKAEEFEDHIFLVTRMFHSVGDVGTEQMSLFLGPDYVLSFQERPGDCFGPLRERIRQGKGRVRAAGADYLCYALLDAVVDDYFPVLEHCGDELEILEDAVVSDPGPGHMARLHDMKRELLTMRRAIWPHRETINTIIRDENSIVAAETRLYFRDVYDHTLQLMDIIETYREIATGLVDVYMSSASVKLNETMKVLTIIATIFIPLGFVASLYGMNFDRSVSPWNMPELGWRFGYLFALAVMALMVISMLFYFRRQGWLGGKPASRGSRDRPE